MLSGLMTPKKPALNRSQAVGNLEDMAAEDSNCFSWNTPNVRRSEAKTVESSIGDEKVVIGEDLFIEICEKAIEAWLDENAESVTERLLSNFQLNPKKKSKKS